MFKITNGHFFNQFIKPIEKFLSVFLCSLVFVGCATYQSRVSESRRLMENGTPDLAVEKLEKIASESSGDQLIYLLDYAVALQMSGQIEKSNHAFIQADKLSESLDYVSVSNMAGSLLFNEEMKQYKGDSFEKIFINAYLAMNFLQVNKLDDALVEARRINEKFKLYRQDEKKDFEMNSLGKYLSAMAWEAAGQYDDAFIAYQEASKIDPNIVFIQQDLIRTAKLSRRQQAYQNLKSQNESAENPNWYNKQYGEVIFIHQQGWGPRKDFMPTDYRFPMLFPYRSYTQQSQLEVDGVDIFRSQVVYDVESAAVKTLNDDVALLMAKKIASEIAKQAVANKLSEKNELLGSLAYIAMRASDRADLRQWSTLPQTIQMVRIFLPAGRYSMKAVGLSSYGQFTSEKKEFNSVTVEPMKKTFLVWRTVN